MITTREFFETDADNIIMDLETFWGIQKNGSETYLNIPFPTKEEFIDRYETGLDSPFDDLSDYDELSEAEEQQMIQDQKDRISETYDKVKEIRDKFQEKYN